MVEFPVKLVEGKVVGTFVALVELGGCEVACAVEVVVCGIVVGALVVETTGVVGGLMVVSEVDGELMSGAVLGVEVVLVNVVSAIDVVAVVAVVVAVVSAASVVGGSVVCRLSVVMPCVVSATVVS